MHWTPGTAMTWVDGDGATAGKQEVLSRTDLDSNGFIINSVRNTYMVDTGAGLLGLSYKYFRNTEYTAANVPAIAVVTTSGYKTVGFSIANPETMVSTDFYVDEQKNASNFNLNDDTWKGITKLDAELHYNAGTVYVYNTTMNAPTSDTYYISVATSTDMINYTLPTNYILENYRYPNVFVFESKYYMIAFNTLDNKWHLIPGTSPTSFDASQGGAMDLGYEMVGAGGWDDTPLFTGLGDNQPEIAGVEVHGGKIYIFYMAGQFGQVRAPANGVTGSPYDSARGIGVFELEFDL